MKKLNKLEISPNPDKLIRSKELESLRGGYDGACTCLCRNIHEGYYYGYLVCESGNCNECCVYAFGSFSQGECQ